MLAIIVVSIYFQKAFIKENQKDLSVFLEKVITGFFDVFIEGSILNIDKCLESTTEQDFIRSMRKILYRAEYVENISGLRSVETVYRRMGVEEVAKNLMHQKIDLEFITMVTGLTEEDLIRLQ